MSPAAWIVVLAVALAIAVVAAVVFLSDLIRADEECDTLRICAKVDAKCGKALTAERDAARAELANALKSKAAQFEAWQAETHFLNDELRVAKNCLRCAEEALLSTQVSLFRSQKEVREQTANLGELAALREECDKLRKYAQGMNADCDKMTDELALLRPIADVTEKFMDSNKEPGEWAPVREALRARKEAGS